MHKQLLLGLAVLALLIAPAVSLAQSGWTSPCSSGATVDETSLGLYAVNPFPNNACLTFRPGRTGTIAARYDVTNTAVPSTPVPPWTTFELGYFDPGIGGVSAILYRVFPCTAQTVEICRIVSSDSPNPTCKACTFPNTTFNYLTELYFVEVILNRPNAEAPVPQACTLRIF
jgi:hypothetical protein